MLYPPPFVITLDERNRYLESESQQSGSFIWYRHYAKNPVAVGSVVYKTNSHAGSYCAAKIKRVTVLSHMTRIKRNCVMEGDALWFCMGKLVELKKEGIGFSHGFLLRCLETKMRRDDSPFWSLLHGMFKKV